MKRKVTQTKTKPISMRLPEAVHRSVKAAAALRGVTFVEATIEALDQWSKAQHAKA